MSQVVSARLAMMASVLLTVSSAWATTYYVSPTGSDANAGTSSATPWASVSKVNASVFQPGDQILFQRGAAWHESLNVPSSGTVGNPIVFDAYGAGAKPTFVGTDTVASNSFAPVSGSTYVATFAKPVNSMLTGSSFLNNATLATGDYTDATNIDYVKNNPNSWYQNGAGQLYVNTGGVDPRTTGTFDAAVRDDLVGVRHQNNIVIRNLAATGSAKFGAGYAFRVESADNVTVDSCDAFNAGKHHFGAIDANGFVGENLYANGTMPQQGSGGATAFVSYSDSSRNGDTSDWNNVTAENLGGQGAFISHMDGNGISRVTLRNIVSNGGTIDAYLPPGAFSVLGGTIADATLALNSDNSVIDGVKIVGTNAAISLVSSNNIVQNVVASRFNNPSFRYGSVIDNHGKNNIIRFSTFDIIGGSALAQTGDTTGSQFYGNIVRSDSVFIDTWLNDQILLDTDHNLFYGSGLFRQILPDWTNKYMTVAQWQSLGEDLSSIAADPKFIDYLNGNLQLQSDSPALNALLASWFASIPSADINGSPRPVGNALEYGAYESAIVPEPVLLAPLAGAVGLLLRRRRTR